MFCQLIIIFIDEKEISNVDLLALRITKLLNEITFDATFFSTNVFFSTSKTWRNASSINDQRFSSKKVNSTINEAFEKCRFDVILSKIDETSTVWFSFCQSRKCWLWRYSFVIITNRLTLRRNRILSIAYFEEYWDKLAKEFLMSLLIVFSTIDESIIDRSNVVITLLIVTFASIDERREYSLFEIWKKSNIW